MSRGKNNEISFRHFNASTQTNEINEYWFVVNVINGVISHLITITLSPAEAGDLNAYFELVPAARKRYVFGQGFLFKSYLLSPLSKL